MKESKIIEFFEGKTIFITGATGFVAKIFLEKILRVQPNIKKLFLLIRPTIERSIEQRLHEEIVNADLFRVLREECRGDFTSRLAKIIPISGDVSNENLGIIDPELRDGMQQEINIIINSAATTKFEERYDVAFGINAMGAMHVEQFSRKCSKLDILLHVSTAFVHGNGVGLLTEKSFRTGDKTKISCLDINTEKKIFKQKLEELERQNATEKEITRAMKDLGTERAMFHGWPNTYVFTKAMGEMLLENYKGKRNIIILRPSVITSAYAEPFSGWIEGFRVLDNISIVDMIPGDMVINCMIAAIATISLDSNNDESKLFVYQVSSSKCNPLTNGALNRLMHRYLTENPLLDAREKPVKLRQISISNKIASFRKYIAIRYSPFLKIFGCINIMFCNQFESQYSTARRRLNATLRLMELYEP